MARFLLEWLGDRGVEAELQEAAPGRPNVIATVKGTSGERGLILNGHIDMGEPYDGRPDPYEPLVENGRLYGAAISNMKGAVAGMGAALVALTRSQVRLKHDVVLTAVVGECDEFGLGTKASLAAGLRARAAICGEPTRMEVRLAHVGIYQFRVVAEGVAAHQKERDRGHNAIYDAARILPYLDEGRLSFSEHPVLGHPQLIVGKIRGGTLPMATAPECELEGDIRIVPGMSRNSVTADLEGMLARARARHPELRVRLECLRYSHPFEMPNDAPIVQALSRAHQRVRGVRPVLDRTRQLGATDSSHLLEGGIPVGLYGPGLFSLLIEDSVAIEDIVDAARVYAATALDLCESAEADPPAGTG